MIKQTFTTLLLVMAVCTQAIEQWPTFGHDNYQSRISRTNIDVTTLDQKWVINTGFRPQTAWAGTAIQDFYDNAGRIMKDMRDYDLAYGMINFDDKLVFVSSSTNSVNCINASDGTVAWTFITEAPVRVSATYNKGKIYFGSDDGFAYCVDATDGSLVWKYRPSGTTERKIIQNGKMISKWPCRTGILISGDTAYCGFSMLPWENTYICAINKLTGAETSSVAHSGLTMEGPLAYSAGRIIASMGRLSPKVFDAATGNILATLPNGGGSFLLISPQQEIIHAPGHLAGWIDTAQYKNTLAKQMTQSKNISALNDKGSILRIDSSLKAIVDGYKVYTVSESKLNCKDRRTNTTVWEIDIDCHYSLIQVGTTLLCGGNDKIKAINTVDGTVLGTAVTNGKVYDIIAANGVVYASTNEGVIYKYATGTGGVFTTEPAINQTPVVAGNHTLKAGPIVRYTSKDSAEFYWETTNSCASTLNYGLGDVTSTITDSTAKTVHTMTVSGLKNNQTYIYSITTDTGTTVNHELNSFFNFHKNSLGSSTSPYDPNYLTDTAQFIKSDSGIDRGIVLVAGIENGQLIYELAKDSNLNIIAIDTNQSTVDTCRSTLLQAGILGNRISVNYVSSFDTLDWPESFANLIISEKDIVNGTTTISAVFIKKYLKQYNSFAYVGQPKHTSPSTTSAAAQNWLTTANIDLSSTEKSAENCIKITNPVPTDHGTWTHMYGSTNNAAFEGEGLGGADATSELELQWIGRPGPLYQADRSGRKTSPLAANGLLFMEGIERLIVADSANGTILWNIEMPNFTRMNIPRDCSNYSCDNENVYLSVSDKLYTLNGYNGNLRNITPVLTDDAMNPTKSWTYDWSYTANKGNFIIGSTVKSDTAYTNFKGGGNDGWYDAVNHPNVNPHVGSEMIFALNKSDNSEAWRYFNATGIIINSTITISDNKVIFMESRESDRKQADTRRLNSLDTNLYLVALNLTTGVKSWEQLLNVTEGITMISMAASDGVIVLNCANNNTYYLYGHSLADGSQIWTQTASWITNNHGKHMSRPAIVGNKIYNRPGVFDLHTGTLIRTTAAMNGGCGTYSCTTNGLFFRNGSINFYSLENDVSSATWTRLRPDCWLSMVPACGFLLAPEGGGGCDCDAGWLEASVAFAPKTKPDLMFKYSDNVFYNSLHKVELQNLKDSSMNIRYTTDGSAPIASSAVYSQPIELNSTGTIKAALFDNTTQSGSVIEKTFTKN